MDPARCRVVRKGLDHLLRRPHSAVGCAVVLRCRMRRRWWESTTAMKSTRPVSVDTVKKSMEAADAR
jgi:hypothetical protein